MIAMDEGDEAKLANCFVEDGVMGKTKTQWTEQEKYFSEIVMSPENKVMTGKEEIGKFASFIKENFPCSQHWEGNVSVKFLSDG